MFTASWNTSWQCAFWTSGAAWAHSGGATTATWSITAVGINRCVQLLLHSLQIFFRGNELLALHRTMQSGEGHFKYTPAQQSWSWMPAKVVLCLQMSSKPCEVSVAPGRRLWKGRAVGIF